MSKGLDMFGGEIIPPKPKRKNKKEEALKASRERRSQQALEAKKAKEFKARPDWSFRDQSKLYFTHVDHQQGSCPALVFEYIGPLRYMNGDKVADFVSVRCINDLGLRAYKAGGFTAVAKKSLIPYPKGDLPDPYWRPEEHKTIRSLKDDTSYVFNSDPDPAPVERPVHSGGSERIAKTSINTRRIKQ